MAGPWEKYAAEPAGPWEKYGKAAPVDDAITRGAKGFAEDMSFTDKFLAGIGKSMADTGRGVGQMLGMTSQASVDDAAALDKPLMNTGAGMAGNVTGQVGQMVVPGAAITKVAPALNVAAKVAPRAAPFINAGLTGGGFAATQPVLTGETREGNALTGGIAGVAGQGIASVAGKAVTGAKNALSPQVASLYEKAQAAGIPVNVAQLSDSKFVKTLASVVEKMPFAGGAAKAEAQQVAFNRAVSREFGEDVPKVTSDVYASAKQRIGGEFERLSARNSLAVGDDLMTKLGNIEQEAVKFGGSDTATAVRSAIDELMSKADPQGVVPGKAYQSLDSKLGQLMKNGGEKSHYLGQLRDAVRSAMDDSVSAADKEAWSKARAQYKALKTVRDLVAKSPNGDISPALLMGRVTANNAGKEAMASGRGGNMGDLAQVGRQFLRDPIPDSGTANRLGVMTLLGGGGYMAGVDPQTLALAGIGGATGGRALNALLNSGAAGRYMVNGLGPTANALALPTRAAPVLLPSVVNALEQ